jgi:N-acylneuraminate cytidylyltransferase
MTQNFDSVFPIVSFGYPVWRGLKESTEGKIQMVWPEYMNSRSQDLEKVYHDAGQWYWVAVKPLLANRKLFAENTSCVHLDELQVQDIDTTTDWKLAELKYELLQIVKK